MRPELSQRVAAVWDEVRGLTAADADRYVRELRPSDPELADELEMLLDGYRSECDEQANSSPGDPDDREYLGEPTISADALAMVNGLPPTPDSGNDAGGVGVAAVGQILGRYQLLRVVGRGAFGKVWQAYDPVLQKHVAVKVSLPEKPGRTLPPSAFLQEARKAASLRHPAVVQVYDANRTPNGWYIVSEFIAGESLRRRMKTGKLSFEQSVRIVATIASALHAGHLTGLIHRDVKPGNILLDGSGNAYLTDFGLAVREDEQPTERNTVSGTLAYMSPEQIRGDAHLLDGRADIYALGAVLYELLTGRPLFRARDLDEYRELILRREPRPPRSYDDTIPDELERICLKCLSKEVRDRYRTAQDLAHDLEAWLGRATPAARSQAAPPPATGRTQAVVIAALLLSALAAAVGLAVFPGGRERGRASAATEGDAPAVRGGKAPTVVPLIWPEGRDLSRWEVPPKTRQLELYAGSTALLQLGKTDVDSWEFAATLRHRTGVGGIGLFLGYRRDPATATATYELVRLVTVGRETVLQRRVETYRFDAPKEPPEGKTSSAEDIRAMLPRDTIRLVVRGNRLREVRFNGVPCPKLTDPALLPPAAGPFGIFAREGDVVVSNVLFNDDPIPLVAAPNPPGEENR